MPKKMKLTIGEHSLDLSSPDKVVFPELGITKLQLVEYYLAVAEGAVRHCANRPMVLKRFPKGVGEKEFFQKRAPKNRPPWVTTATLHYKSGWSAEEACIHGPEGLAWMVNTGCIDINPHPLRADDMEHPDEFRIDLDPNPGVEWEQIQQVAMEVKAVLDEHGLVSWPKTSGSRGIHINVRIHRTWTQPQARAAALALAREVEDRMPGVATAAWKKEERHGVFIDYNQNAKDRTVASAFSVRAVHDARVSWPLTWDEVNEVWPQDYTLLTVPALYAERGDAHADIDQHPGGLESLIELGAGQGKRKKREPLPLLVIAKHTERDPAMEGLERWKAAHPEAAALLQPADVLVDKMRGRYSTWTRIRVNLQHVPIELRPEQGEPDPNVDPTAQVKAWAEGRMKTLKDAE
jgi:bifunctional non-homologous end joining protein LigD